MAGLLQLADHFKAGETVVVIFHDHGTRYLARCTTRLDARKGLRRQEGPHRARPGGRPQEGALVTIDRSETVDKAARIMTEQSYSQIR